VIQNPLPEPEQFLLPLPGGGAADQRVVRLLAAQ
jgi:hypothetical protein